MERKFSFIITVNACVSNGRGSPVKESYQSALRKQFSFICWPIACRLLMSQRKKNCYKSWLVWPSSADERFSAGQTILAIRSRISSRLLVEREKITSKQMRRNRYWRAKIPFFLFSFDGQLRWAFMAAIKRRKKGLHDQFFLISSAWALSFDEIKEL